MVYMSLIVIAFSFLFSYGKISIHIYLNQLVGNSLFDNFFYYLTYLGDGLFMPVILILILMYNARLGVYSTLSFFAAAVVTNILKYQFFNNIDRPYQIFQWTVHVPIKYVNAEDLYIHNSFPSGHATQVFAIFMCLAFYASKPEFKFMFFILAVLASFSRVYLSQHWLPDITAGSLIGTFFSILFYIFIIEKNKLQALNKPLLKSKKTESTLKK